MNELEHYFNKINNCETCLPYLWRNFGNGDDLCDDRWLVKKLYLLKYLICRLLNLQGSFEFPRSNELMAMYGESRSEYSFDCSNAYTWLYIEIGRGAFRNWQYYCSYDGSC